MPITRSLTRSLTSPLTRALTEAGGGGGGAIYPLDDVGGTAPAFAYSTNKLTESYSGPALRVVRPSDSVALDIGFVGADLDSAALDAFLGSQSGQVDTWYDQMGAGLHATQTTAADRPVIEPGNMVGGAILIGGKRTLVFGPTAYMNIPAGSSIGRQAAHLWVVAEPLSAQISPIELGTGSNRTSMFVAGGASGPYIALNPGSANSTFRVQNARASILEGGLSVGAGRLSIADQTMSGAGTSAVTMTGGRIGNMTFTAGYEGDFYCSTVIAYGRFLDATARGILTASLAALTGAYMSATRRVITDGDSIAAASAAIASPYQYGYSRMAQRMRSAPTHAYTLAGGGNQLQNIIGTYNNTSGLGPLLRAYSDTRIVHLSAGTNDFNVGGRTDAQLYADLQTYCGLVRADGGKVVVSTVLPATGFSGTTEPYRVAYNANVRANWASFADGLCDFAAHPIMGAAGAQLNADLYTDGLHPSRLGHFYLAPTAAAPINALL